MNTLAYFKEHFDELQSKDQDSGLQQLRQQAFSEFEATGIPTTRNEEWKYTRISSLFNKDYYYPFHEVSVTKEALDGFRLPGYENAHELFFVNGVFAPELSKLLSQELVVLPLDEAVTKGFGDIIQTHLGSSGKYLKDGINALNTAFVHDGVFIHVPKGKIIERPVYIYNITDARSQNIFAQPRSLVHVAQNAQVQFVETYATLGTADSFTNQVMELVAETDARVEYYKIQNDASQASQVSTTHIHQVGKCFTHAVTISLNGGIVRNNLNIVMDADHGEANLFGLYFQVGESHIDNHTLVDNVKPHCLTNQLYKGVVNDNASAVFNGKIFVRQAAQKTNAYQSNKNILLSDTASVNAKPQLEIFADDVKCSHGCTIGQLDDEALFYLQSRGIEAKMAKSLLVHAFAFDILEHINLAPIRDYVDELIIKNLHFPA